jgi:hypothetical protein
MTRLLAINKKSTKQLLLHYFLSNNIMIESFKNTAMKKVLTLIICLISVISFSQEKEVNNEHMKMKLAEVQLMITSIDNKINTIEYRVGPSSDPETIANAEISLAELRKEKSRLEKIQYSTEHYLNEGNTSTQGKDLIIISKEDFERYPKEHQDRILAHPERYQIENN